MATIESKSVHVEEVPKGVFSYLSDLSNYQELLPEGKFSEWQGSSDHCSFRLNGVARVELEKREATPEGMIVLDSTGDTPVAFELHIEITPNEKGGSDARLIGYADLNPFMEQMVKKPLKNLFDHMAEKLRTNRSGTQPP